MSSLLSNRACTSLKVTLMLQIKAASRDWRPVTDAFVPHWLLTPWLLGRSGWQQQHITPRRFRSVSSCMCSVGVGRTKPRYTHRKMLTVGMWTVGWLVTGALLILELSINGAWRASPTPTTAPSWRSSSHSINRRQLQSHSNCYISLWEGNV